MPDFHSVTDLLIAYRYWILFPLVVIEGPIVTIIAGFLVTLHYFSFIPALLLIVIADIFSDSLYYSFGRWGAKYAFLRIFKIPDATVDRFEQHVQSRLLQTIALSKVLHGAGAAFLVAVGSAKAPFLRFMVYTVGITVVKSVVLLVIGYFFGSWIAQLESLLDYVAFVVIAGIFAIACVVLFRLYRPKQQ